jgi:hypothetical protein
MDRSPITAVPIFNPCFGSRPAPRVPESLDEAKSQFSRVSGMEPRIDFISSLNTLFNTGTIMSDSISVTEEQAFT